MTLQKVDSLSITEKILSQGKIARIPTAGVSMHPLLKTDDVIFVKSAKEAELNIGDIIVRKAGDRMFAHRLIKKSAVDGKTLLFTKGDSFPDADNPTPLENIVGKVVAIEKTPFFKRYFYKACRWLKKPAL